MPAPGLVKKQQFAPKAKQSRRNDKIDVAQNLNTEKYSKEVKAGGSNTAEGYKKKHGSYPMTVGLTKRGQKLYDKKKAKQ